MPTDNTLSTFTPQELRKLRSLKNPYGIQKLLNEMPYHLEDTAWSPRKVLAENLRTASKARFSPLQRFGPMDILRSCSTSKPSTTPIT